MAKTLEIGYVTENPAKEYSTAIRKAKTKAELVKTLEFYKRVADDAYAVAVAMKDKDIGRLQSDLKKAARQQSQAWLVKFNAEWGAIAMPAKLLFSSVLELEYHVPWGCAFIRCEEEGWPQFKQKTRKA